MTPENNRLEKVAEKLDDCTTALASLRTDVLWIKAYIKMTSTAVGALTMAVIGVVTKLLFGI